MSRGYSMTLLDHRAAVEQPAEVRDCNMCRCLDIMASRAWCSDETGTYRDESALSDVRVQRTAHRLAGECSRPADMWGTAEPE